MFLFKQKTAYEMRISDWSSDVCSSDLKLKGQLQAIEEGDLPPETVTQIATQLDVPEQDVINMNRRLASPDHSLNAPLRIDGEGEWQDWLVDENASQEIRQIGRGEGRAQELPYL